MQVAPRSLVLPVMLSAGVSHSYEVMWPYRVRLDGGYEDNSPQVIWPNMWPVLPCAAWRGYR